MAIYRLERKSISRGNKHNLVAAVAYRAGLKLTDSNKLNEKATTHDYTQKTDVAHNEILLPDELSVQMSRAGLTLNLEEVANLVEKGETTLRGKMKMGAKLANEYVLAGSHELSIEENIKAFQEFAKQQAEEQNVIAMVFVHDPKFGNDMSADDKAADNTKSKDPRNIHAHIVLLSRQVELKNGELRLGKKCDSDVSNDERTRPVVADELVGTIDPVTKQKIQQGRGLCSNSEWLKGVRESWANIQNKSLARHNLSLVTHRSYKDLGLKFKPSMHLGKNASHLESIGVETYLGKHNESIYEQNRAHLKHSTSRLIDLTEQGISDSEQRVGYYKQQAIRADRLIASRARAPRPSAPNPFDEQYRASINRRKQRAAEFNKRASAFDRETDYYNIELETATERVIKEVTQAFLTRSDENFDERQLLTLDNFAQENELTLEQSKDYRDYLRKSQVFFEKISLSENERIIRMLRDPQKEWLEHEKTNDRFGFSASKSQQPEVRAPDLAPNSAPPKRSFRP